MLMFTLPWLIPFFEAKKASSGSFPFQHHLLTYSISTSFAYLFYCQFIIDWLKKLSFINMKNIYHWQTCSLHDIKFENQLLATCCLENVLIIPKTRKSGNNFYSSTSLHCFWTFFHRWLDTMTKAGKCTVKRKNFIFQMHCFEEF